MKSLILGFLFVSLSSFACPDLSGTYNQCESDSNRDIPAGLSVEIKMLNQDTYLISYESDRDTTTQEVIADGIEREGIVTSSQFGRLRFKVTATCEDMALMVTGKTRFLGLPLKETTQLTLNDGELSVDRVKNGRVVESCHCQ